MLPRERKMGGGRRIVAGKYAKLAPISILSLSHFLIALRLSTLNFQLPSFLNPPLFVFVHLLRILSAKVSKKSQEHTSFTVEIQLQPCIVHGCKVLVE